MVLVISHETAYNPMRLNSIEQNIKCFGTRSSIEMQSFLQYVYRRNKIFFWCESPSEMFRTTFIRSLQSRNIAMYLSLIHSEIHNNESLESRLTLREPISRYVSWLIEFSNLRNCICFRANGSFRRTKIAPVNYFHWREQIPISGAAKGKLKAHNKLQSIIVYFM